MNDRPTANTATTRRDRLADRRSPRAGALGLALALSLGLGWGTASAHAQPAPAPADDVIAAQIDALLRPVLAADAPGATVIVTRGGRTVFRGAYGMADVEAGRAMRPDDVLRIASMTKQFTAVAVLLLVEEGKLRLDQPFTDVLTEYPKPAQSITIEQLLTHSSGIPNFTDLPDFAAQADRDVAPAQLIARFEALPLQFPPGTRASYSNSAYVLLGAIIERASGLRYAEFMAQRIFEPLGLRDTAYEGHERHGRTRVSGYRLVEVDGRPTVARATPISMTQPFSAGALVSSVDDLARWDAVIAEGRLLSAASWRVVFTPSPVPNEGPNGIARGWFLGELQGRPMAMHSGGIQGFSSDGLRIPSEALFSAVLMNTDAHRLPAAALNRHIAAIALGEPLRFNADDAPVYVRGTMNAWGTSTPLQRAADGTYRATVTLEAGPHEFKIGSADWRGVDLGAAKDATVRAGDALPLAMLGGNLRFVAPDAARYRLTLDVANPLAPTLRIER